VSRVASPKPPICRLPPVNRSAARQARPASPQLP
jgi:hypothetical protein